MTRFHDSQPRRGRAARRGSAVVAVVTTGVLLAGCAEEIPQPVADEPFTGPVLTVDQETAVIEAVSATLEEADAEGEPKRLNPRVAGPAREVRARQIEVAELRDDDAVTTEIPTASQRMIIPTTETWPRVSFSITDQTEDLAVPRLVAYQQSSARGNYKLWSWVQLIPGTTMPNFADPEVVGSEAVAADDDSLVVTPAEALSQYADVVSQGIDDSEFGEAFALPEKDDLSKLVQSEARAVRGADEFQDADGEFQLAFAARDDGLVAVRTLDGGALVMGVLDGNARVTVEEDGEIDALTDTQRAIIGDDDQTNELYVEYTDQVALYVPPSGSEDKMRPLGFSHVQTDAARSIPDERNTDR